LNIVNIDAQQLAEFVFAYARNYREAYSRATTPPPNGPGYPAVPCSPFLVGSEFDIYIARDGVVINHIAREPEYEWFIAGGPALKVDYEPTRTPPEVTEKLRAAGILGKRIGIYRIVAKKPMRPSVWRGRVRQIAREIAFRDSDLGIALNVREVLGLLSEVVNSLSFGAYGHILDIRLPTPASAIGQPHLIKNFGIFTADLGGKRFFSHLELHGQADRAAWDTRTIPIRVQHDLRRDLAAWLADPTQERGGSINLGGGPDWIEVYSDRLARLEAGIAALRAALQMHSGEIEAVFHKVLADHPLLLDVYGTSESKPRFVYPEGTSSPIGKKILEPDFLVRYPDCSYKLIEVERPSKNVATEQGQPRAEVTQAVFQCAEWRHFIKTHYQVLSDRYPEIQTRCKTAVIMSRNNQLSFKGIEEINAYKGLMMEQFRIDEFYTYDDLYDRAKTAYELLSGLRPGQG
jgi:hypothetical protein